jgi:hypothetical protein
MTYLGSGLRAQGTAVEYIPERRADQQAVQMRSTGAPRRSAGSADEVDRSSEETRSDRDRTQRRADRQGSADEVDRSSEEIRSDRDRTQRRADRQGSADEVDRTQRRSDQIEIEPRGEQINT